MAQQLDDISKGVASATGSELLGNLAANVVAGVGGTLVGGTAGASTASSVQLYNQMMDMRKAISKVCSPSGPCSESLVMAVVNAQGANAQTASQNMATEALYGVPAAAVVALGPEAIAAALVAGGYDFAGSTYSYINKQSQDAPNFTSSYIAGIVGGLTYPLTIGDAAIAQMGKMGKISANTYNALVNGVGASAMQGNNPDVGAGVAVATTGVGSWAKAVLPSPIGNMVNQIMQGSAGPIQTSIQNTQSKK